MILKFTKSRFYLFFLENSLPCLTSYLLAWLIIAGSYFYFDIQIEFNEEILLPLNGFAFFNLIFYHALKARHRSLRFAKRKSGWKIFLNHMKVLFILFLLAAVYFRSLVFLNWPVWWPAILFPFGYLTLVTGILRFLVKRKM